MRNVNSSDMLLNASTVVMNSSNWTDELIVIRVNDSSSSANGTEEDGWSVVGGGHPIDSLLNILIAFVLAVLILTTAIGTYTHRLSYLLCPVLMWIELIEAESEWICQRKSRKTFRSAGHPRSFDLLRLLFLTNLIPLPTPRYSFTRTHTHTH